MHDEPHKYEIIDTTFSVFVDTDLVDLSVVFKAKKNQHNLCVHTVCECCAKNANDGSPRKS